MPVDQGLSNGCGWLRRLGTSTWRASSSMRCVALLNMVLCVMQSVKGDARVGLASSAGAIGGGSYELRAPFGSVVLAESRLISKPGVDTRALEVEYGSQTSQERVSLLESDSEDINHATVRDVSGC
jgi:hypothetical protein